MNNIKTAFANMHTPSDVMDFEKFEEICELVDATPDTVADFIDGGEEGWPDVDETQHNNWLKNADANEIAGWISSGL